MRIVVSGTHASGKSTLVSDVALTHRRFRVLPDPFELVDGLDPVSVTSFHEQLLVSADRLTALPPDADVIAERGPLDFLAYLEALELLHRGTVYDYDPRVVRSLRTVLEYLPERTAR